MSRWIPATPQYQWALLSQLTGAHVWVKQEHHTPTDAFKVRGAWCTPNACACSGHRSRDCLRDRGNHGQSLAFAGTAAGLEVAIVVPPGNSPDKNAAMRGLGAEVIERGHDFQAALEHSAELARERDFEAVPPFHPDLVLGVATYARELVDEVEDLDTVHVPVGIGSGMSGLIRVRDLLGLRTDLVGVVPEQAPATARSFAVGHVVTTESALGEVPARRHSIRRYELLPRLAS